MKHGQQIVVWNEYRVEREEDRARAVYPDGLHTEITRGLREQAGSAVRVAVLDEPEHGLTEETLADTAVLLWWAHRAHHEVSDTVVQRVVRAVHEGMGFVVLHSAHFAKPFIALMGTSCRIGRWNESGEWERIRVVSPGHPVAEGLPETFTIARTEMYGEPFDVPPPEETFLVSTFESGATFPSGCVWTRGWGRVLYLRPGHETYPVYRDPNVRRLLRNAVRWLRAAATSA